MTPLKKRRLAREAMNMGSPYPPTPSTPTAAQQAPIFSALSGTASEGTASEGEKSVSDSEGPSQTSMEETSYLPNGIKPHIPLTPSDNLFEVNNTNFDQLIDHA